MTAAAAPSAASVTVPATDIPLSGSYWRASGRALPVLLIHGLAANHRVWTEVGDHLAGIGHPVLALDLRGHGASAGAPDPAGGDPILVSAQDMAWACASFGWSPVLVAGHSWGANVALQLAADLPGLVAGLALVDGGWRPYTERFADLDTAWRRLAPADLSGWTVPDLREVLTDAHPDWSSTAVEATVANLEQRPDGTLRPWLTPDRHRLRIAGMFDQPLSELHQRVKAPTVLLAADEPPHESAVRAAEKFPRAELIAFPGGEHDLHLQFPARVAAAIARLG